MRSRKYSPFDLPPEVSDDALTLEMEKFGKVERIVREKFPANLGLDHLFNGVRGVHIDIKKDIPPLIEVSKQKGKIFYEGLRNTCFSCHAVGHRKDSCPNRRTRGDQKPSETTPTSYAGVVAGKNGVEEMVPSIVAEDSIIEILEDDVNEQETDTTDADQEQQPDICEAQAYLEKQTSVEDDLETASKAILEPMGNQANQRRAQFAASRSSSGSGSSSRPRKKCVRMQYY